MSEEVTPVVEAKKSVKETLELLEGVKLVGAAGRKVWADKKINLLDLSTIVELASKGDALAAAFDGVDQIPSEVGDLSQEETIAIVSKVFEMLAAIKAAKA